MRAVEPSRCSHNRPWCGRDLQPRVENTKGGSRQRSALGPGATSGRGRSGSDPAWREGCPARPPPPRAEPAGRGQTGTAGLGSCLEPTPRLTPSTASKSRRSRLCSECSWGRGTAPRSAQRRSPRPSSSSCSRRNWASTSSFFCSASCRALSAARARSFASCASRCHASQACNPGGEGAAAAGSTGCAPPRAMGAPVPPPCQPPCAPLARTCFTCCQDSSHCRIFLLASSSCRRTRASSAPLGLVLAGGAGPLFRMGDGLGEKLPETKSQMLPGTPFKPVCGGDGSGHWQQC